MIIYIAMHWNDLPEIHVKRCYVGDYDPNNDDIDDENIFYYFDPDEKISGDHTDFTVVDYLEHTA